MRLRGRKVILISLGGCCLYMLWSLYLVINSTVHDDKVEIKNDKSPIEVDQLSSNNIKRSLLTSSPNQTSDQQLQLTTNISTLVPSSDKRLTPTVHSTDTYHTPSDIYSRGMWQRLQMFKFCREHGLSDVNQTLPNYTYSYKNELYRHMIYDNNSQSLFCFMPKVGCTNMRLTLLLSKKLIPFFLVRIQRKKYLVERKIERSLKKISFLDDKLTENQKLLIIRNYHKFTILRHPLERLLSAYLDKLDGPVLKRYKESSNYFERLKGEIYDEFQVQNSQKWPQRNVSISTKDRSVSFSMFLEWLISQNYLKLNEHFMPQFYNCEPCRFDYHFYGNFENFTSDANLILSQFHPDLRLVQDRYASLRRGMEHRPTYNLLSSYYSTLPVWLKRALYANFTIEFDFYHSLFPQHKSLTIKLLEI